MPPINIRALVKDSYMRPDKLKFLMSAVDALDTAGAFTGGSEVGALKRTLHDEIAKFTKQMHGGKEIKPQIADLMTGSAASKFTPEQTRAALESLAPKGGSYRRMDLANNPALESYLSNPLIERGYVLGSMSTNKTVPGDMDISVRANSKLYSNFNSLPPSLKEKAPALIDDIMKLSQNDDYHLFDMARIAEGGGDPMKFLTMAKNIGFLKYGQGHKWTRVAGAGGVAVPSAADMFFNNDSDGYLQGTR